MDNIEITVKRDGNEIKITLHNESLIHEQLEKWKVLMSWLGYHNKSINDSILDAADEIKREQDEE